jgi:hypothetical protein
VAVATLALALMAVAVAQRLISCHSLRYSIDDQRLTIARGLARWVIPLAAVQQVSRGDEGAILTSGWLAPGFRVGQGYIPDGGRALFFASLPAATSVVVRTANCAYVLSPSNLDAFCAALEAHKVGAPPVAGSEPGPSLLIVLRHPLAVALAALAALANAALYAYIAWWMPVLPAEMPVHFTAAGMTDRWGPALSLSWLPQTGSLILAANLVLVLLPPLRRFETTVVLLGASLVVQAFLWVAFLRLLP